MKSSGMIMLAWSVLLVKIVWRNPERIRTRKKCSKRETGKKVTQCAGCQNCSDSICADKFTSCLEPLPFLFFFCLFLCVNLLMLLSYMHENTSFLGRSSAPLTALHSLSFIANAREIHQRLGEHRIAIYKSLDATRTKNWRWSICTRKTGKCEHFAQPQKGTRKN